MDINSKLEASFYFYFFKDLILLTTELLQDKKEKKEEGANIYWTPICLLIHFSVTCQNYVLNEYWHPCFTNKKTEAQKGKVTISVPRAQWW